MKLSKIALSAAALGILGLAPVSSSATTATNTFQVTANVVTACTIGTHPLAFGTYVASQPSTTAQTTIDVTCGATVPYQVGLSGGLNGGNSEAANGRIMITGTGGSTKQLNYGLFTDATWTTNWGNAVGSTTLRSQTGSGALQSIPVYGQIPTGQSTAIVGSYSDTITVTVTY